MSSEKQAKIGDCNTLEDMGNIMTEEMKQKQLGYALISSVQDIINVSGALKNDYNDRIAGHINIIVSGMYSCLLEENDTKLAQLAEVVNIFTTAVEPTRH